MGIVENAAEFARKACYSGKPSQQSAQVEFEKAKALVALVRESGGDEHVQALAYLNRAMEAGKASQELVQGIRDDFGQKVLEKVLMLTKTPGENAVDFLSRIKSDSDLRLIFICEIVVHLSENPPLEKQAFYSKALMRL